MLSASSRTKHTIRVLLDPTDRKLSKETHIYNWLIQRLPSSPKKHTIVATRPGAQCQCGHRSARQPRISGRAVRSRDLMIIITQSGTKVLQKGFTRPSWGTTCPAKHDTDQSIFGSGSLNMGCGLERLTPQALAGLLVPSISHGQSSCLSRRWLPPKTWLHEKSV